MHIKTKDKNMDPKLKVFLSSAQFEDEFLVERDLLEIIFTKEPLCSSFILQKIENQASPLGIISQYNTNICNSDLFIILLGKTLGDAVRDEFVNALKQKIPIFAFIKEVQNKEFNLQIFIKEQVQNRVTICCYNKPKELPNIVEESLQQYYYHNNPSLKNYFVPIDSQDTTEEILEEEKSLRLLVGIIGTEFANITREKIFESLTVENEPQTKTEIKKFIKKLTRSDNIHIESDFEKVLVSSQYNIVG